MPERPLRIAWIAYGSLEQLSGGYIYDRLVVEGLRRQGDAVTVVSLEPGAPVPAQLDVERLGAERLDAVVGDELCFRELGPLFRRLRPGPKRVLLIHHLSAWEYPRGPERAAVLELERAAIGAADTCVATSRATADRLHAEGLADGVAVVEPGADRLPRPLTAGQEPSGSRLRLLFIGNIEPRKRVLELCEALARLSLPSVELVLVGAETHPEYAAEVRQRVLHHGLADRVRFLGQQPAAAVTEQLSLADALVLPSALEGYGMVLSEALWAAIPVLAARVGAAERLVHRTAAGLLFEPDDQATLAATLGDFAGDPALRRRLRSAARVAADALPRWHEAARKLRATLVQ